MTNEPKCDFSLLSTPVAATEAPAENPALTALLDGHDRAQFAESRIERLLEAIELGASQKALEALRDAVATSKTDTIKLPCHRYENLSRGRGWARKGRGTSAEWGDRCDGGYRVGPGRWTVGGHDGFARKGENVHEVKHVDVAGQTWTVRT